MISRFLPVSTGDTVLNYYLLPLVGTSRRYFGEHFITTKVNKEGTVAFVEVSNLDAFDDHDFPNKAVLEDKGYLFYKVPNVHFNDVQLILSGKYSKLSGSAKKAIKNNSGLQVAYRRKNTLTTSKLILALDRKKLLIDFYYDKFRCGKIDKKLYKALSEVELAEKVGEEDFI